MTKQKMICKCGHEMKEHITLDCRNKRYLVITKAYPKGIMQPLGKCEHSSFKLREDGSEHHFMDCICKKFEVEEDLK